MTVRAKMKCFTVDRLNSGNPDDETVEIRFFADYNDGDPANEGWSKYTPSANISMMVTNPDAISQFEPGKYYYVDFTPV